VLYGRSLVVIGGAHVERVFVYDFNSGPLLRPLLQYYAHTGLMQCLSGSFHAFHALVLYAVSCSVLPHFGV
jgi:hypothetical protein